MPALYYWAFGIELERWLIGFGMTLPSVHYRIMKKTICNSAHERIPASNHRGHILMASVAVVNGIEVRSLRESSPEPAIDRESPRAA